MDESRRSRHRRFLWALGALGLIGALVGLVASFALRWVVASKDAVIDERTTDLLEVQELVGLEGRAARKARAFLLTGNERFRRESDGLRPKVDEKISVLRRRIRTPVALELLDRIEYLVQGLAERLDALSDGRVKGVSLEELGRRLEHDVQPLRDELDADLSALEHHKQWRLEEAKRAAGLASVRAANILTASIGAALLLSAVLVWLLVRAHREVETAAQFQQRVIAIVGHDLRSPLSAILASVSHGLLTESLEERQRTLLERVKRAAKRVEVLAGLLVDYTRTQTPYGVPIVPERTNLHRLATDIVDELRAANTDGKLELETIGEGHGDFDGERIAQVITNLVDNAFRYGAPNRPVRVRVDGTNPSVLALHVVNEGKPIDPTFLPHIFEPFRHGRHPQPVVRQSLGMGLYIVQAIVRGHGGEVIVESTPVATTFTVLLPRIPAMRPQPDRRPSPAM